MLLNAQMAQKKHNTISQLAASDQKKEEPQSFESMLEKVGKSKDKECFIQLFNHFAPRIKSFLIKNGLNIELADELAQETMLTIWNKAESYNPKQAAASTWIFTIARNKRIDHLRKVTRHKTDSAEDMVFEDNSPRQDENYDRIEESKRMSNALKILPEEQLTLIKKSFYEDKSHAKIAEETGIPLGTVKSRIRLALERLRKETGVKALWN